MNECMLYKDTINNNNILGVIPQVRSGEGSVYANLISILKRKGTIAITNNTTVEVQEIAYSSISSKKKLQVTCMQSTKSILVNV